MADPIVAPQRHFGRTCVKKEIKAALLSEHNEMSWKEEKRFNRRWTGSFRLDQAGFWWRCLEFPTAGTFVPGQDRFHWSFCQFERSVRSQTCVYSSEPSSEASLLISNTFSIINADSTWNVVGMSTSFPWALMEPGQSQRSDVGFLLLVGIPCSPKVVCSVPSEGYTSSAHHKYPPHPPLQPSGLGGFSALFS